MKGTQAKDVVYAGIDVGVNQWVLCISDGQKKLVRGLARPSVDEFLTVCERRSESSARRPKRHVSSAFRRRGGRGGSAHRELEAKGIERQVVDSLSIEVPRRFRRMKTDKLEAKALIRLLI